MADIGQTNTYDPDVSWHFHESYYLGTTKVDSVIVIDKASKKVTSGNPVYVPVDCYIFRRDEFGDNTYEMICDFAGQNNYYLYNFSNQILVFPEKYFFVERYDNEFCNQEGVENGETYLVINKYVKESNSVSFPGDKYIWEIENVAEPTPEPTAEPTPTPGPGGDDTGTEINPVDPVDIDSIDDASEILREIYKQDTTYYRDMLEVQQNAFDFQVVHVSLMFCSVFLCGILVGCAFARSLWHKMNAG